VQVEYELEDGTTVREAPEELTPAPVEKPAAPAEPEFVDLPPPIVLGGRVRVRTALPTLPPIPPDGATMTDLAKTPGKFPSGKPVVVHALLQSKSVNYRAGAEVGQIRVANENRSYLPVEVCVPRSLGVDLAGSDDGAGMYLPVRLTVYPVPEASARNPTRPVYVATEIGFFNDKQEVEKTLRAEGAAEDHVRSAEVAFSRPQPVTAPVHAAPPQPADGRWWFEKVPAWAYGTAGLLFFAVFCVVAAVVVSLVRSSGRQKSRRRKNAEPDAEFEDEEPDAEEPEDRPRRG
jgi:hypothetical protein